MSSTASRPLILTTPIYYVNDVPHIGHAYTTVAADVLARHHRNFGRRVFFLTGTDEHGQKVQKAAADRGVDAQKHCDEMVERFSRLWGRLNISHDAFIRTTDAEHVSFVQRALSRLREKNEIYEGSYDGWYCVPCERYWTDKEAVGDEGKAGRSCPDCRREVNQLSEKNYFFKMGKWRDSIVEAVQSGRMTIIPSSRGNEVLGFLDKPLEDLCVSRPKKRLAWGIPMPFDPEFVTYVWFDALLNYASAPEYGPRRTGSGPIPGWEESETVHLIGKDILTTHAVYWPAMLAGLGMRLPDKIVAHGWWTAGGQKMSKSVGNVVDPNAVVDAYGADAFRYFVLREVPFGQDGDYSEQAMAGRINADLADSFGNLVGRVTALVRQKESGRVPLFAYHADAPEGPRRRALADARALTESFQFSAALGNLADLFARLNKKINDERPWESADDIRKQTLATCAVDLARGIFLLSAYTPALAEEAARRLGCTAWFAGGGGIFSDDAVRTAGEWAVTTGDPLVKKTEPAAAASAGAPAKSAGESKPAGPAGQTTDDGIIDISEFQKSDLRVARIMEAERVTGSDKLIRLNVTLGGSDADRRQVVAGIGKRYSPESLIGRNVIVIANLKSRKVFGVESRGMVLAAGDETTLCLISPDGEIGPGARVK